MKLHILGSCSGTEPMPDRKHTSWVLEEECGKLLWFDAGEGCARTGYLMGLDVFGLREIFISHPHMDHVAGLPGLLNLIVKLCWVHRDFRPFDVNVHLPVPEPLQAARLMIETAQGDDPPCFRMMEKLLHCGKIYRDDEVTVEALPNLHRLTDAAGRRLSCSFRIRRGMENIVYSGDVRSIDELAPWLDDCDLLMMETGHHRAFEVCRRLREAYRVRELLFLHHGVEILADPDGELARAEAVWGKPVMFASDRMTVPFPVQS